jgi:hypothetical protein
MPLCLSWHDTKLSKNTKFCIPQWLASHPEYLDAVRAKWTSSVIPRHPAKRWLHLKKTIRTTAMTMMKKFKAEATTRASELTIGISVYRAMKSNPADWDKALSLAWNVPELAEALDTDQMECGQPADTPVRSLPQVEAFIERTYTSDPLLDPSVRKKPNM